jgi:hypothetical protein
MDATCISPAQLLRLGGDSPSCGSWVSICAELIVRIELEPSLPNAADPDSNVLETCKKPPSVSSLP